MSHERQTRRNFLRGVASPALSERFDPAHEQAGVPDGRQHLLVSVRRRAMACEFEVQLAAARNDNSMEQVFAALDLVEALESQMTVYRDDSEVIRINRRAGNERVSVEPRLFALLEQARQLHEATGGAFDITSGPLSEAWGFSRREGRVPSDEQIAAARERVGMQHVELDARSQSIAFDGPGMSINLNSMGKGYALDRMAELLAQEQISDFLLHGGKSSVLVRGNQPGSATAGWRIGVRHPLRPDEQLAEITLRDAALSTSGAGTQFFVRRGRRYGHILDPRTGYPAEGLYSATAIAPTAAEAEGLSTAFYVMGPEKVGDFCASRPHIGALLVAPGEREAEVRVITIGLDDTQVQRAPATEPVADTVR